jgi:hypothetical protein
LEIVILAAITTESKDLKDKAQELRDRTKQFALRIIRLFRLCLEQKRLELLEDNSYGPEHQLLLTIGRLAERDQGPSSCRSYALSWKKLTKVFFG